MYLVVETILTNRDRASSFEIERPVSREVLVYGIQLRSENHVISLHAEHGVSFVVDFLLVAASRERGSRSHSGTLDGDLLRKERDRPIQPRTA